MKNLIKILLKSLSKTREKYWNISPKTGQFLNFLISEKKPKNVLEIGTSNGYSGIWIAEALSHFNGHLYTIESHKKERFHLAQKNFEQSGLSPYITSILGHAPEAIPPKPKYFDLVFLDATKYEHLDYFQALENRLKKGGMIITDNINSHKKDLAPYLKAIKKNKSWHNYHLNIGTGLMISSKIKTI